ncbi:MAG TPA: GGDEF domain-containing protein [Rubrobacter sp.]|nr:GGDEF domain-containing protein [Rubrobacter sp.]
MANVLASPHIFEIAFDALTAAVGGLVVLLALRVGPALTLSAHRLALRISIVAAVLITAAQLAEVLAVFSRLSTVEDAAADVAELIAVGFVGLALHQMGRAEREEISPLRRAADVDHLTGLVSRSFLHRAAERRIELYRRNGLPLACAVLDVDDFKSYNDSFGHGSGDEALRCVGRVLHESTRADDVVARYGGEEFVVLMGGNIEDAIEVAERVRRGVEHESVTGNGTLSGSAITVSVGVAALTEDVSNLEQLVEKADDELYRAKRAGKNRVAAAGST